MSDILALYCTTCEGSGSRAVPPDYCTHHSGGHCECEWETRTCPDCKGTGGPRCEDCREHTATAMDGDDAVCAACKDLRVSERKAAAA